MPIRVGLMGFGRIGRNIFRQVYDHGDIDIVAISDLGSAESMAYLLEYDTIYGRFPNPVSLEGKYLKVGRHNTRLLHGTRPEEMPWDAYDVDVVVDTTLKYRHRNELQGHLDSGAQRVILSSPALDEIDRTLIHGINHEDLVPEDRIISCSSGTCLALGIILKILDDAVGVHRALMTSVHAYTSDQKLSDAMASELRRARSAAENIIPNRTWAPRVVGELLPQLKGHIDGMALNVPVPNGSNLDLTVELKKSLSAEEVNAVMAAAAAGEYSRWLGFSNEPVVSSDVIGRSESAVMDSLATISLDEGLVKLIAWYDNGWGITARIVETLLSIRDFIKKGVA